MKPYYAAIAPDGQILGLESSAQDAVELAKDMVGGPIMAQVLPDEPAQNPKITADEMPVLAERNCQIPKLSRSQVMSMDLKQAHALLKPFFDGLVTKGAETTKYNTVSGMADAWTGQNYKTEKPSQDPGRPAEMMGLTLVPAWHARMAGEAWNNDDPYLPYQRLFVPDEKIDDQGARVLSQMKLAMYARWKDELPSRITKKFNWCVGSSKECRDSCLVFAGQNASTRYNTYRKVAQAMALLNQPVAFVRMLVESIDQWLLGCTFYKRPRKDMEVAPFFRLNMLSDIPWERIAPWLFDHFSNASGENGKVLRWYDYTKVPGRRAGHVDSSGRRWPFPRNYDLTFSLSGEESNKLYALQEIEQYDSRIAVVFLAYRESAKKKWEPLLLRGDKSIEEIPLPRRFWGLSVRDGDRSDVRPHDPQRTCVGLRWKIPSGKRSGTDPDYAKMSFVTPIYVESANQPTSLARPNPGDDDVVLISAVTPRFQAIEHPLSQAI